MYFYNDNNNNMEVFIFLVMQIYKKNIVFYLSANVQIVQSPKSRPKGKRT